MPNEIVPVAGEAMPANLSRRFFLGRMGGVAAASALAAAPVAAANGPAENPNIVALGKQFDSALVHFTEAAERVSELQPKFRATILQKGSNPLVAIDGHVGFQEADGLVRQLERVAHRPFRLT